MVTTLFEGRGESFLTPGNKHLINQVSVNPTLMTKLHFFDIGKCKQDFLENKKHFRIKQILFFLKLTEKCGWKLNESSRH